jgi:hypothetical protein
MRRSMETARKDAVRKKRSKSRDQATWGGVALRRWLRSVQQWDVVGDDLEAFLSDEDVVLNANAAEIEHPVD